jgi:5-methylcytosine-specific restriction endonuclease McrA
MPSRRPCLGPGPPHLSERGKSRCAAHATTAFAKAKLTYTRMPENVRQAVLARDGHKCVRCGSTQNLEVDHIVPVARGGRHTAENGRTLCRPCHLHVTAHYPWRSS